MTPERMTCILHHKTLIISVLLTVFLLGSCKRRQEAPPRVEDYTADAGAWADSLVRTMSLPDLAAQLVMPALYSDSTSLPTLRYYTDSLHVGGVILLKGDALNARRLVDTLRVRSRVLPLVGIDAEWGLGMRIADAPVFPRNGNIPASVDDQTMYDYGVEMAREASVLGINVIFGPVLDVDREDGTGILGSRLLGKDAARVADLGVAYARGLEDGGMISVAKHFPGHGAATVDSHKELPVITRSAKEMSAVDLQPFARYISEGLQGMMIGHLAAPALDSVARSAVVSPAIVTTLLRKRMGFRGLVFTDAMNMKGLGTVEYPIRDAVLAGADIILAPSDTPGAVRELVKACERGELPRKILEDRCRRLLFVKYSLGLVRLPKFNRNLLDGDGRADKILKALSPHIDSRKNQEKGLRAWSR